MRKNNIICRLRLVASFAVVGGASANFFLSWIDRSVNMPAIGALIGAGAASLMALDIA